MARRAGATEAEIRRAIKAALALGLNVVGVRLDDGKVEVLCGDGASTPTTKKPAVNEWDEVFQ